MNQLLFSALIFANSVLFSTHLFAGPSCGDTDDEVKRQVTNFFGDLIGKEPPGDGNNGGDNGGPISGGGGNNGGGTVGDDGGPSAGGGSGNDGGNSGGSNGGVTPRPGGGVNPGRGGSGPGRNRPGRGRETPWPVTDRTPRPTPEINPDRPAKYRSPFLQIDRSQVNNDQLSNAIDELIKQGVSLKLDEIHFDANHDEVRKSLGFIIDQNKYTHAQLQGLEGKINEVIEKEKDSTGFGFDVFSSREPSSLSDRDNPIPLKIKGEDPIIDLVVNAVVNNQYRSQNEWLKVADIKKRDSVNAGVKYNYRRLVYWSTKDKEKGKIRIMEIKNSKGLTHSVLVFAKTKKNVWKPYYFSFNKQRKTYERYNSYFGVRMPQACVKCHGGSVKKLTPNVTVKGFEPKGWFFK